mgnify:FL=1
MFVIWFVLYFVLLGAMVFLPLRLVMASVYGLFPGNQVAMVGLGALLLATFAAQIYFSYKAGVIKAGGQVGFFAALRLAVSEFTGYVRIAFSRSQ